MRAVFLAVIAAIVASSCSKGGGGDELVVYSGRSDKFVAPVVSEFSRRTGIDVVIHNGEATALLNSLRVEGKKTPADLYLSNDAGTLALGGELGLFRPMPASLLAPIEPALRADDRSWVGLSARARVIVVNTQSPAAEFVRSVFDLADPRLRGRLGITHSSNESFVAGLTVYMLAAGREQSRAWLEGIRDNADGRYYTKHGAIVSDVAAGVIDVGLVNHYYIYRYLDEHPGAPIRMIVPDQGEGQIGTAWNVAGIGISRYTDQPAEAERLVGFLLSVDGQKLFAELNKEYPARPDVPAAPEVAAAGRPRAADVPMSALGPGRAATVELLKEVGIP